MSRINIIIVIIIIIIIIIEIHGVPEPAHTSTEEVVFKQKL